MNKIIVENDTMRFYSTPAPIPVGGSQWSKIFFMFSDEWEDLRKIAQFRQGELKINVDIDSNNFCYVPNEMLPDMCGELSIVGYPQDTASAVIATANSLMLNFVQGFKSGGEPAVPPTPDLYQKLLKEFAESGGGNPDAVLYTEQELTEAQQKQARANIGALDVNIKTTPVDIGVGLGSRIYYVQSGWLKPCPDNADKELKLQYRRVFEFIGSQRLGPSSQNILLEAKSAYALYQKGLASESIVVTNNPLRAAQVYVKWNLTTRNNKHYFYYAQISTAYQYTCTYCVEDDALTNEFYERPIYRTVNGVGEQDSVSQFPMRTNPTEDMHIATKKYVDTAKTEAQQLGLTAATPGQIIKVKTVQDGKPTEWEAVDDRLPKVSASDAGNVLGVEQIGEHEYGYALTHMPTLSDFIPLGITNASPGQFAKVSFVDDFGGPTAWEAADIYEKPTSGIPKSDLEQSVQTSLAKADTAISLGLTAATPGQIIKVKTVQDGKPTEWEAVDMPSGEEWEKVADIELRADTALYVLADFAVWRKAKVIMSRSKYVGGLNKNVWCRVAKKNNPTGSFYNCGYLTIEYGYVYWDFSAEVSNSVISSTTLRNNNPNAVSNVMSTQTLTPLDLPPTDYELTLVFTDTSVIQDGDKVTVIGVRR